jgi:hypothetical protein
MHTGHHMLTPFALDQGFQRVLAMGHLQLAEDVRILRGLVLCLYIDVVGSLGIGARADRDEFGTLIVEHTRICRGEVAATEFLFERLG